MTVKQEGPLPTPRSSSKGSASQSEKKEIENIDSTVKSEPKEDVTNEKNTTTSESLPPQVKEIQES